MILLKEISYIINQNIERFYNFSEYSFRIVFYEIYNSNIYH